MTASQKCAPRRLRRPNLSKEVSVTSLEVVTPVKTGVQCFFN